MAKIEIERPSKEIIAGFRKVATPNVSDAMDKFGLNGVAEGFFPVIEGSKIVGPAFTVRYVPYTELGARPKLPNYLEVSEPGDIIVVDSSGCRIDCTAGGELLALGSKMHGTEGHIINGAVRDIPAVREIGYPMFARAVNARSGKRRNMMESMGSFIRIGVNAMLVRSGDIIIADDSAVVVVPKEKAKDILEAALEIAETEEKMLEDMKKGLSLGEVRKKYKYFDLTRPVV